ncbi:MAG: desulfoferrodoxin [Oscillospiraceae bacterium]|jgi:superoxide reductase|nr:desulfoferrodoxin [Oscillospiraceae bacterium]MDD3261278.1 desulfoferrodoxin family protein [Oscillospiraceae bacterium]
MDFYICERCGNIVTYVVNKGTPLTCCGQKMKKLEPNTTDAAVEKHVPVIRTAGGKVTVSVGSTAHPMLEKHYIQWIALETKKGLQRKALQPGDAPEAAFLLTEDDAPVAAYAYCNLHGLWKAAV